MLPPPHSLHRLHLRWCSQMLAPRHSLQLLRMRWCSHKADLPQSLHLLRSRWCSQMPAPRQSMHLIFWRWHSQEAGTHCTFPGALVLAHLRTVALPTSAVRPCSHFHLAVVSASAVLVAAAAASPPSQTLADRAEFGFSLVRAGGIGARGGWEGVDQESPARLRGRRHCRLPSGLRRPQSRASRLSGVALLLGTVEKKKTAVA